MRDGAGVDVDRTSQHSKQTVQKRSHIMYGSPLPGKFNQPGGKENKYTFVEIDSISSLDFNVCSTETTGLYSVMKQGICRVLPIIVQYILAVSFEIYS